MCIMETKHEFVLSVSQYFPMFYMIWRLVQKETHLTTKMFKIWLYRSYNYDLKKKQLTQNYLLRRY